jgi:hypothetical protein
VIFVGQMGLATSEFASRFAPDFRSKRMLVYGLLIGLTANDAFDLFLLLCS